MRKLFDLLAALGILWCLFSSNPAAAQTPVVPLLQGPVNGFYHAHVSSLGTSLLAKSTYGTLAGFNCTGIAGSTAGYCVAYDASSVPSSGALTGSLVLDVCYFDSTPRGCSLAHLPNGVLTTKGIVILITSASTPFTYTTGTDTGYISADFN